jgi:hypothetical protein
METQALVDFLNKAMELDRMAVKGLFSYFAPASKALMEHPTIETGQHPAAKTRPVLKMLGLLNGFLGEQKQPAMVGKYDPVTNELSGFAVYSAAPARAEAPKPKPTGRSLAEDADRLERANATALVGKK